MQPGWHNSARRGAAAVALGALWGTAVLGALLLPGCGSRSALGADEGAFPDGGTARDAEPDGGSERDAGTRRDGGRDAGRDGGPSDADHDAGPQDGCSSASDCRDPEAPLCCVGGFCPLGFCISGPAPIGCEEADCGEGLVCVPDECGWANCVLPCEGDDCAARGLTCNDGICTFDCHTEGYAGCEEGTVCRENGRCGVRPCEVTGCGPQDECAAAPPHGQSHRLDGCQPRSCSTDTDCPDDGFCVNGGCSEVPGMCSREPEPPPSPALRAGP